MGYAVRTDGTGWRAVDAPGDVGPDETYSEVQPAVAPEQAIAAARTAASSKVNTDAEAARLQYITPGAGQAMTYDQKLQEARLILVDSGSQVAADAMDSATLLATYPMIWASIPADGTTPSAVAAAVHATALAWAQVGAQIEKKRRAALTAVSEATTLDAVEAAAVVDWSFAP